MLNTRSPAQDGFTLVEIIIALVILGVAVLGMSASTTGLVQSVAEEEINATVLQAVEDRLAEIRMDPRYASLDSLYNSTETDVLGLEGFTRVTDVTQIQTNLPGAGDVDVTRITVTVTGPFMNSPLTRYVMRAAP
jgi:prepilin-type N-terminal cleavage/methylation domain-containing protein